MAWNPTLTREVPYQTENAIRELFKQVQQLKALTKALSGPLPIPTHSSIKSSLQAGSSDPLNLNGLLGQAGDAQLAQMGLFTSVPSSTIIQAQADTFVTVSPAGLGQAGGVPYRYDTTSNSFQPVGASIAQFVNVTPVSVNGNTIANQALMSVGIPAGALNMVGKTLRITCYGTYDVSGGAPTVIWTVFLGSLAIISLIPSTPNTAKTSMGWRIRAEAVVTTAGSSAALEGHGDVVAMQSSSSGAASATTIDNNTSTLSPVDLTAQQSVQVFIAFNPASTSNVGRQRKLVVEVLN